jgi:hypothetical protein
MFGEPDEPVEASQVPQPRLDVTKTEGIAEISRLFFNKRIEPKVPPATARLEDSWRDSPGSLVNAFPSFEFSYASGPRL